MVKTTIILEDELYRELVDESVREYGSTRKLSLIINRRLRNQSTKANRSKSKRLTIKLGRNLTEKELEKSIERGSARAIKWNV